MAYVGTRTTRERQARGEGLCVYAVDPHSGRLQLQQVVPDLVNPSFLAMNRRGTRLYTVHGDQREVSVLAVQPASGHLSFLQQVPCGGLNPVHLALSPEESHLVVSGHLSGLLSVLPVHADGTLGPVGQQVSLPGEPGPHRHEQPFAKPHFNPFTPDGRFVIVPDKGLDRVFSYAWRDGVLQAAAAPWYTAREGSGPRNVAFHPQQAWAYVVNELDSTVTACHYEGHSGALRPHQILSLLPDDFVGHSRAAAVAVSNDGQHLYASNRGHDSITVFDIEAGSGRLRWRTSLASGGRTPRFFALHPDQPWLYALNEGSDSIEQFASDPEADAWGSPLHSISCGSPVCMVFGPSLMA